MVGVVVPWRDVRVGRALRSRSSRTAWSRSGLRCPQRHPTASGATRRCWASLASHCRTPASLGGSPSRPVATTGRSRGRLTRDATYHALVAAAYAELIALQASDPGRDGPVPLRVSALALGPLLHVGV